MIEIGEGKIHFGDCLNFINTLPNESLDLVLTDPPYGDGTGYGRHNKTILNNEDESINYKVIPLLYDKCMYLFTNWKFVDKIRNFIEEETKFSIRMIIVIVKNNIGMGYGFRNQYELCIVAEKGNPKYKSNDFSNVLKMEHIEHNEDTHPHQKGISVLIKMIEHSTEKGDIVFDPFAGSGSTGVACVNTGRKYLLCETDQKYIEVINKRVKTANPTLF